MDIFLLCFIDLCVCVKSVGDYFIAKTPKHNMKLIVVILPIAFLYSRLLW